METFGWSAEEIRQAHERIYGLFLEQKERGTSVDEFLRECAGAQAAENILGALMDFDRQRSAISRAPSAADHCREAVRAALDKYGKTPEESREILSQMAHVYRSTSAGVLKETLGEAGYDPVLIAQAIFRAYSPAQVGSSASEEEIERLLDDVIEAVKASELCAGNAGVDVADDAERLMARELPAFALRAGETLQQQHEVRATHSLAIYLLYQAADEALLPGEELLIAHKAAAQEAQAQVVTALAEDDISCEEAQQQLSDIAKATVALSAGAVAVYGVSLLTSPFFPVVGPAVCVLLAVAIAGCAKEKQGKCLRALRELADRTLQRITDPFVRPTPPTPSKEESEHQHARGAERWNA